VIEMGIRVSRECHVQRLPGCAGVDAWTDHLEANASLKASGLKPQVAPGRGFWYGQARRLGRLV
jgi:hypothetical protein